MVNKSAGGLELMRAPALLGLMVQIILKHIHPVTDQTEGTLTNGRERERPTARPSRNHNTGFNIYSGVNIHLCTLCTEGRNRTILLNAWYRKLSKYIGCADMSVHHFSEVCLNMVLSWIYLSYININYPSPAFYSRNK